MCLSEMLPTCVHAGKPASSFISQMFGREKEYESTSGERNLVMYGLYCHPLRDLLQKDF